MTAFGGGGAGGVFGGGGGGGGYGGGGGGGSASSESTASVSCSSTTCGGGGGGAGSSYGPGITFAAVSSGAGAGAGGAGGVERAAGSKGQNGSILLVFTPWAFSSLNSGTVGSAYSQTITATGGVGAVTYAVTAGSLPAGLTLSSAGELSGTPTAGGSFSFTVEVTDSSPSPGPFQDSFQYTLVIDPATIAAPSPAALPAGTQGASYSPQTLTASGGTAPYSFAVTNGALPSGITLTSAGLLSGTPTVYGSFPFEVTATDASTGTGPYGSPPTAYTLVIAPSIHSVGGNVSGLAAGKSVVFQNNGGDNLPVAADGAFTFSAPVANGSAFAVTVLTQPAGQTCTVSEGSGTMGASNVTNVAVSCVSGLAITAAGFGNLQAGQALAGVQLVATGGSGSYTWSAGDTAQPLPAGLSLSASGLLTGTPTTAGTYNSLVTVTDGGGASKQMLMTTKAVNTASQVFSGTVVAAAASPTATPVPSLGALAVVLLNLMAAALGALGLRWRCRSVQA
ncbi:MAG: putative Ig domain-containing protein [Comamonas sp.]